MTRSLRAAAALVAVPVLVALAGCGAGTPDQAFGAQSSPTPDVVLLPVPSASPESEEDATTYVTAGEALLPSPDLTPGAVFPDVAPPLLCEVRYTQGVLPPRFEDKQAAFARYGVSLRDRDQYQVDHLVPVGLGGSNAPENLWPQPYSPRGAAQKDDLETHLRSLVCAGQLDLAAAQQAVAKDWSAALDTYRPTQVAPVGPVAPPPPVDPFEVRSGGPCPAPAAPGLDAKGVRFTCTATAAGALLWSKRY